MRPRSYVPFAVVSTVVSVLTMSIDRKAPGAGETTHADSLTFPGRDGQSIRVDRFLPTTTRNVLGDRFPAVVLLHGADGLGSLQINAYYHHWARMVASAGYSDLPRPGTRPTRRRRSKGRPAAVPALPRPLSQSRAERARASKSMHQKTSV
jgi:hypothetical protein